MGDCMTDRRAQLQQTHMQLRISFWCFVVALAGCGGNGPNGACTAPPVGTFTLRSTVPMDCPGASQPMSYDVPLVFGTANTDGGTGATINGYPCTFVRWTGCEVLLTCQYLSGTADLTYDPSAQTFSGSSQPVCACTGSGAFTTGNCSLTASKG
jgi:hypothetical protein